MAFDWTCASTKQQRSFIIVPQFGMPKTMFLPTFLCSWCQISLFDLKLGFVQEIKLFIVDYVTNDILRRFVKNIISMPIPNSTDLENIIFSPNLYYQFYITSIIVIIISAFIRIYIKRRITIRLFSDTISFLYAGNIISQVVSSIHNRTSMQQGSFVAPNFDNSIDMLRHILHSELWQMRNLFDCPLCVNNFFLCNAFEPFIFCSRHSR